MDWPSVIYQWKYRRHKSDDKVLAWNIFLRAFLICKIVDVFFFLLTEVATKMGITDDQYSGRRIPSVMLSVKMLPMNCVSYTDGINLLVKLFNGVVEMH
jgi:hypothetical protein